MNRTLFAATAAVLAACPAPAAAQLSSDISVKLGFGGEWRTSTGYEGTMRVAGDKYVYTGFSRRRGDESVEELTMAGDRLDFRGTWLRINAGQTVDQGTVWIQYKTSSNTGSYTDGSGTLRGYRMCKRPGTNGWSNFDPGTSMWTRKISASRIDGGPGVTAVVEFQYIGGSIEHWLSLDYANAMLKGPNGETYRSDKVTNADGSPAARTQFALCGTHQLRFHWNNVPSGTQLLESHFGDRQVSTLSVLLGPPAETAPAPAPTPAPAPEPIPPAQPAPSPAPAPAPGGSGVPAGAAAFGSYGPWQYKVDEFARGPDGHFQLVFTVRNASRQRLPFSITDFDATLIDADGRSIRRLGNLHAASVTGPASALERIGMSYLEPGETMRARVIFPGTKGWNPVTLRIKEPVRSLATSDFPLR